MAVRIRFAGVLLLTGMALATLGSPAVLGAEPTDDMRASARILASQETPASKRDQKGFCAATYGSPDYAVYTARACQMWVKNNMKKAEECSEAGVRQEIKKDTERCLAMSGAEFDKQLATHRGARDKFVASMKEKGLDGEKLLQEERAKLR